MMIAESRSSIRLACFDCVHPKLDQVVHAGRFDHLVDAGRIGRGIDASNDYLPLSQVFT